MLRLVADGALDYPRLVLACCETPARLFGLFPAKGTLRRGADADLVVVDPRRPLAIRNDDQLSRARATPFAGWTCPATPVLTLVRGTVVARDGQPTAARIGRFVAAA
jgi:dihydroorotase-like cyclic amidohydrolase